MRAELCIHRRPGEVRDCGADCFLWQHPWLRWKGWGTKDIQQSVTLLRDWLAKKSTQKKLQAKANQTRGNTRFHANIKSAINYSSAGEHKALATAIVALFKPSGRSVVDCGSKSGGVRPANF